LVGHNINIIKFDVVEVSGYDYVFKYLHEEEKDITIKEFREKYNIGYNNAYKIIHQKDFPCVFVGMEYLIISSEVDKWFEKHIGESF